MKIKELVILSVIFMAIIITTLLMTRNNAPVLPEENKPLNVEVSQIRSLPSPNTEPAPVPLVKHAVSITKIPMNSAKQQENQIPPALTEKGMPVTTNNSSAYSSSSEQLSENTPNAGIHKEGKFPSKKEVQELNSAGIVMY